MNTLAFHNTQFDIVDRSGQPWLRANQIGLALDYSDGKAIQRIYARHKDEFTDAMTGVVKLTTPSGDQETRIFSLRGAHLLAMFARTAVAKEFRHWVLDVLEGEAEAPAKAKRKPKLLPNGLTGDQQDAIKALVKARVEELPESKRAKAAITCWSSLKSKFGCTYKEISPEQFTDAVSLIARVVLEGEWMGKSTAFSDIIGRPLTRIERWMVYTDFEGNEQYKPIPYDACVMTHRELIQAMVTPGDMPVSTEEMFEFAMAALANLKGRSDYQARQLKHLTDKKRQGGKQ
ncbi:BRO-N domain-containing protein [Stutzerimonas nitrititolerans]|uniref:BRO-N domain-containing protein n=1 Tax=Stutzerimonas nitrititolerans TaxID=2482751 RepID=UPI0028AF2B6A|nr:Bro-N domain-containing protein [Stutzerimonas nitrititolerans]